MMALGSMAEFAFTREVPVDSAYWHLSLPELESFRSYYLEEMRNNQVEKEMLIKRGIADGERLLRTNPDTSVLADILIRLADLYYYKEKDDYLIRMAVFDSLLENVSPEMSEKLPPEPEPDFTRSLALYDRILDEFPGCEMIDDALYNKGFLFEETGEFDQAFEFYNQLISGSPLSSYVPEAYMRMGEYHFNPPRNQLDKAIEAYKSVIEHPSHVRYYEALYKLGWSHYRLSEYPAAISYFTTLVENQEEGLHMKQGSESETMSLRDEALEYIAISFLDFGGPSKASDYTVQIGQPEWGRQMLEKMGDIYKNDKEDYRKAVMAYGLLRRQMMNDDRGPEIQKKIVECYEALNEFQSAFQARNNLFLDYKPGSDWWLTERDEEVQLTSYRLTAEALRDNFNWLLKASTEENTTDLAKIEQTVATGRQYLNAFPEDLYAYQIRWNVALLLDTRLKRYYDALKEYLTISMVYQDDVYQSFARERGLNSIQDAAENAIVVAGLIYDAENTNGLDTLAARQDKDFITNGAALDSIPLSNSARWLAMAYENFIKLFPFDSKTPTMLTNTGALYYAHNQFDEALKYFKTLHRYFPDSEQARTIQYSILESYFGKRDFESVEILAKRILAEDYPADIRSKAEKRLGESIFLRAQEYAEQGEIEQAANEYMRMTLEVPNMAFADRALFNAGQAFEQLQKFVSAIRAYELLRVSYAGSVFFLDAVNNLALDYAELGEFGRAADRYLQFAKLAKDSSRIHDAYYNAHLFYVKAENWPTAIQTGDIYRIQYPANPEAAQISFNLAEYAGKSGQKQLQRRYYKNYIQTYTGQIAVVEAAYRLGMEYIAADSTARAIDTFKLAQILNQDLIQGGSESNDFFAAEGLVEIANILRNRMDRIRIIGDPAEKRAADATVAGLRSELVTLYREILAYKTTHLPEMLYRIGHTHEQYALIWAKQSLSETDPAKRAVESKTIHEKSTTLLHEAYVSYSEAVELMKKVIGGEPEPSAADTLKELQTDSTLVSTGIWLTQSETKISEMLYRIAEVNSIAIDHLLAVPFPEGLETAVLLEYRSQVLLQAILPLVDTVTEAHMRNLSVSAGLGLNNEWMEESRQKVLKTLAFLGKSFMGLSFDALNVFSETRLAYFEEVRKLEQDGFSETPAGMATLIELSKSYARAGIQFYERGIGRLKQDSVVPRIQQQFRDSLYTLIVGTNDVLVKLQKQAADDQQLADSLYQKMQQIKFEDMLTAFEDNAYFLSESQKAVLEDGFRLLRTERDLHAMTLGIQLLRIDTPLYSERFNLPVKTIEMALDSTWLVSEIEPLKWKVSAEDSNSWMTFRKWSKAQASIESPEKVIRLVGTAFELPGFPVDGFFELEPESPASCYLNALSLDRNGVQPFNLTRALQPKRNWLVLKVTKDGVSPLNGRMRIRYVPVIESES